MSSNLADLPPQLSIDALNTITPNLADLPQICWQIYPLQLSIDAVNTVTSNLADLPHKPKPTPASAYEWQFHLSTVRTKW